MPTPDNTADLYAELRATVMNLVHDTMNTEIPAVRALVRHVIAEELDARMHDIAREVLKEINDQVRLQSGRR
jgi:hypothetical protein